MLGVIVPARNEEKNIGKVLSNLINCNIKPKDIFVIDNASSDKTSKIANDIGVNVILCEKVGYQQALKRGFKELNKRAYKKFLIIDGDNEIGIQSIQICLSNQNQYHIIIGYRNKIKRIGEKIVNMYFNAAYGIHDLMCGVKCGNMDLYNESNHLEFGMDFFHFKNIGKKNVFNFPIDLNPRNESRLGNIFIVNIRLITNLIKFLIYRK